MTEKGRTSIADTAFSGLCRPDKEGKEVLFLFFGRTCAEELNVEDEH